MNNFGIIDIVTGFHLQVLLFFGETLLFLTWCPVADILLAVIPAPYRATANASQMLVSHLLGDAGSPYIVGLVSIQN